ncbi:MAG: LLM class flavin-dependent oxidoreductase [Nakamurella sp.]
MTQTSATAGSSHPCMSIGVCFPRSYSPSLATEFARATEAAGLDELWFVEDCFYSTAPPLAAVALAATERIGGGLGILPAVVRTAAMTAMEISTLEQIGPGRLIAGIGHGVQSWMQQMGVRPASPLTALGETLTAVRSLLRGEHLDEAGRVVTARNVALVFPPATPPPVIAGVRGAKSLQLAGQVCDGVLLDAPTSSYYLDQARTLCAAGPEFQFRSLSWWSVADDPRDARAAMAPGLLDAITHRLPMINALPFSDALVSAAETGGVQALIDLPQEYWTAMGAVGTLDDAAQHVRSLADAGLRSAAFFLDDDPETGRRQIQQITQVIGRG